MHEFFFKYVDADTAKLVLKNQTFRFSSPTRFNDPFDIQHSLIPEFDIDRLPKIILKKMEDLILSDAPLPNTNGPFAKSISIMRNYSRSHGFNKSRFEENTSPLIDALTYHLKEFISEVNSHWRNSTEESRVFCVTEDNDNLLMWAHYAKDHTGIVFQIATLPELDTPLSVARKVKYEAEPMQFYSIDEILMFILFETELDVSKIHFSNHAHRKSNIWSYEKEWRVLDLCSYPNKTDSFVDHEFIPSQLQKIFLGCRFNDANLDCIITSARNINPSVEILRAKKHPSKYELTFEPLKS